MTMEALHCCFSITSISCKGSSLHPMYQILKYHFPGTRSMQFSFWSMMILVSSSNLSLHSMQKIMCVPHQYIWIIFLVQLKPSSSQSGMTTTAVPFYRNSAPISPVYRPLIVGLPRYCCCHQSTKPEPSFAHVCPLRPAIHPSGVKFGCQINRAK